MRTVDCKINGQIHSVKCHCIVDMPEEAILECESCEKLNLVRRAFSVTADKKHDKKQLTHLFTGLGKLPGEQKLQ